MENGIGLSAPNANEEGGTGLESQAANVRSDDTLGIGKAPNAISQEVSTNPTRKENPEIPSQDTREKMIEEYTKQAIDENIIAFNSYFIKKAWPKAYNKCIAYMSEKAHVTMGDLDEETILGVFLYSPRTILYEFFDSEGLFVNIVGERDKWYHNLEGTLDNMTLYPTRVKTEVAAFHTAFEKLNQKS